MKQKCAICALLFFVISISCKKEDSKTESKNQIGTERKFDNKKTDFENEPQNVALAFYNWYLKDIYLKKFVESPDVVLSKDSIYVLDVSEHKKFLKTSGYFSSKFYENEKLSFKDCEDKLRTVSWKQVEESGAVNPAEYVEGNECAFTHYMIWTNGQGETLNKAEIEKYSVKANTAVVVLKVSDSLEGGFYSRPHVSMVKENGKWKISKIEVTFE
ncbi:hypothetical protein [Flavobacterium foetidum]|uniref:hypothetical protein n=1 Tax=Flavobacterium foetidum TaxID=2026681 RepID=UPI0010750C0A|nr:hypothetical protein [Flavobacterium foetidum]KAF2509105.1 hypothetical protein E0W73_19035 [Flavobacterium foetidum]